MTLEEILLLQNIDSPFLLFTSQDEVQDERQLYLESLKTKLAIPLIQEKEFFSLLSASLEPTVKYGLFLDAQGILQLQRYSNSPGDKNHFSPLFIDFITLWHRQQHFRHSPLSKALGIKGDFRPVVIDGTCGVGKDSILMLSFGCHVWAWERSPVVAALLENAYQRALSDPALGRVLGERFHFMQQDFYLALKGSSLPVTNPDVIYLDPMFATSYEKRKRKGAPCKEMLFFHELLGEDADTGQILELSMQKAQRRVVVKRPLFGSFLQGRPPTHSYKAKAVRYDMYATQGIKEDFRGQEDLSMP